MIRNSGIGTDVVVTDHRTGQQLVDTTVPWGTPLRVTRLPESTHRLLAEGQAHVTPVFVGAMTGKPRVTVIAPVMSGAGVTHTVSVSIDTLELAKILHGQGLPDDRVMSISDATGTIAARSANNEKFAGQPVNPEITKRLRSAPEGGLGPHLPCAAGA